MKKAVSKSKKTQSTPTKQEPDEFLILGHLIKYNLYLLSKSVVFFAIMSKCSNLETAVKETNEVMSKLDLDSRRTSE
jgi:hypothetical protein